MFSCELFIALRYLFSRRKQTFIYLISLMSIFGVAIGVASLIIVLGIYNGMTTDIRDKILGANAHGMVLGLSPAAFDDLPAVLEKIRASEGVTGAVPFLYAEGMLSSGQAVKGVVLRGIDPKGADNVLSMLSELTSGSVEGLDRKGLPGIIVGNEMALRLGLRVGSRVNLLSPSGQKTSAGFAPRIRPFEVVGIFRTGMFEYDSSLAFLSLPAARDVMGLPDKQITGVEITVNDVYHADAIAQRLEKELGMHYQVRHWMEMNANLFAALRLEKIGMFILLTMVVIVGSFSIVTALIMLVMEKTRDIAVLMAMGATQGVIRRIFMIQGTIIGIIGTALGYVFGISLAWALSRYQFIKLPKGVYTIDHLPVLLQWSDVLLVGVCAMSLCFLATIYPARQASRLEPVDALRYE